MTTNIRPLRLAFMGTPDFSVPVLNALISSPHEVVAVYAQPPRPTGRGHHVQPTPVHQCAEKVGIPVYTPTNFKHQDDLDLFKSHKVDLAIVVAYGLILPQRLLDMPTYGCVNIHASLLPRWRGAAPIQRAIEAGDTETGICLMKMEAGLDTGPVYACDQMMINQLTASELHDRLSMMGANLLMKHLDQLPDMTPVPQPIEGVTYAHKIQKTESQIDWNLDAHTIHRKIRAFTPWPGQHFSFNNEQIKVLAAEIHEKKPSAQPGHVLDDKLTIACGHGTLTPLILQRPGRKALPLKEFLLGLHIPQGTNLCPVMP